MGSPLKPLPANTFMCSLEQKLWVEEEQRRRHFVITPNAAELGVIMMLFWRCEALTSSNLNQFIANFVKDSVQKGIVLEENG